MFFLYCFILSSLTKLFIICSFFQILIQAFIIFFILKFILNLFQIEIAASADALSLYTTEKNVTNIVCVSTISAETNIPDLVANMKKNAFLHKNFEKLKKVIKYKFGLWYWTYCSTFNIENHIEVLKEGFTDEELYNFMSKHASEITFSDDKPYWKAYIAPKMKSNKTAMIFKIHHSLGDGVSLMSYLLTVSQNKNVQYIKLTKIKGFQWIPIYIIGFFKIIMFFINLHTKRADDNEFKKKPLTGVKNGYCSQALPLLKIREYAKLNKVSINDTILAMISNSLMEVHHDKYNLPLKEFSLLIAASLRPFPTDKQIYPISNNINFLIHPLLLNKNDNFDNYVKKFSKSFSVLKTSYDIYCQALLVELLYNIFPTKILAANADILTLKNSAVFSSVPGPLHKINLYGSEVDSLFFIVNSIMYNPIVMNVITYNEKFVVSILVDESTGINSKEFIENFNKKYENL